jgi:alpha-tubulin suppressor-like RCC1 family protein
LIDSVFTATSRRMPSSRRSSAAACWLERGSVRCRSEASSQGSASAREFATSVVRLANGRDHHCALDRNGVVRCWGANEFSQCAEPAALDPNTAHAVIWP